MNHTSFLGLFQNAALLLTVALIFGMAAIRWRTGQSSIRQVPVGISLGAIGIVVMLTPWTFVPGIAFDARSVLICISGLFFGSVATAIAMAMTAVFRFYQGGTGVWTGVAVILTSGAIGIAWRHFRFRPLAEISWRELYLFGLVVHVVMLAMMFTLPWETALRVLTSVTLPVLVIYPLETTLLGVLMTNRLWHERMEEVLRDTETRYRLLFEHSPDGILIIDPDTAQPLEFNETAHTQLGYSRDEFSGLSLVDLEADETPEETRSHIAQVIHDGRHDFETRHRTRSGEIRNVQVTAQVIEILGKPVYHCIWRDITERKRADDALRESDVQLKKLTAWVPGMIYKFMKRPDGTYCVPFATDAIQDIYGCSPQDVRDDFSPITNMILPEDLGKVFGSIECSANNLTVWTCEYRVQIPGRPIRWLLGKSTPEKLADGSITWYGFNTDITEHKRVEEALRNAHWRMQSIIEGTHVGTWEWNVQTGETIFNEVWAQILGYTLDELAPISINTWETLCHPKEFKTSEKLLERHFAGELPYYDCECRMKHKDGHWVWVHDRGRVITRTDDGRPLMMFGTHTDITERKRVEEALKESEKRYRELSIVDDLSQLYNSRYFYHQLQLEISRANRYGHPLTLLLLDLDDFKAFNDTYGHVEGDHVLFRLGQVVKRCLRKTDSAYRYGGEEFTVLLPMTTREAGAMIAERIRTEFKAEIFSPKPHKDIHVTVSIGLAQYEPQEDMKAFVHRVDQLMYQGKKDGKDRVCSRQEHREP